MPMARPFALAAATNCSPTTTTEGIPMRSRFTESSTLPDVQLPHLAKPVTTPRHCRYLSSRAWSAGRDSTGLASRTTSTLG